MAEDQVELHIRLKYEHVKLPFGFYLDSMRSNSIIRNYFQVSCLHIIIFSFSDLYFMVKLNCNVSSTKFLGKFRRLKQ